MDRDLLLPVAVPDRSLRQVTREVVPFRFRVAVRRLPALFRWSTLPQPIKRQEAVQIAQRSSPLRRPGTTYDEPVQQGKERNVARVVRQLHGCWMPPQARWSWNDSVGPPLQHRGFVLGPELQDGKLALGVGGGACQVANLVFWLGMMAGMEVIERHRHQWDLYPDAQRDVPFGCGATVYWPHRDLVLRNPHRHGLGLQLWLENGRLHGAIHAERALPYRWELVETAHRFMEHRGEVWRLNTVCRTMRGPDVESTELLFHNKARVRYPVSPAKLWRAP